MDSSFVIHPGLLEPMLLCGIVSMVLYGVLITQVFHYFDSRDNQADTKVLKFTVAFILILETSEQAFLVHTYWYYFIFLASEGTTNVTSVNWSFLARLIPAETGAFIVECIFVIRIWILSGKPTRYLWLFVPVLVGFGAGIATITHEFLKPALLYAPTSVRYIAVWSAVRMFTDLSISGVTCWRLYRWRGGISSELQSVIWSIFLFSLITGLLSSLFALLVFVSYLVGPFRLVFVGIHIIYSKIYSNSLLASLNNRRSLRDRAHREVHISTLQIGIQPRSVSRALFNQRDVEKSAEFSWSASTFLGGHSQKYRLGGPTQSTNEVFSCAHRPRARRNSL